MIQERVTDQVNTLWLVKGGPSVVVVKYGFFRFSGTFPGKIKIGNLSGNFLRKSYF